MSGHNSVHPILFLHSSGLGAAQWTRVRATFPNSEAPELSGYGGRPWAGMPAYTWADDVAIAEQALARLGSAHVVGHSYGAFLALQLARRHPVRSVFVWEPVAFPLLGPRAVDEQAAFMDRSDGLEAWLEGFLGFWNGEGAWQRMSTRRKAPFMAHGEKVYAEVLRAAEDRTSLEQWAEVTAPTLLVSGATTRPEAAAVCQLIADAIPNARHDIAPGAGHMGPVTHGPELVARLHRWFQECS